MTRAAAFEVQRVELAVFRDRASRRDGGDPPAADRARRVRGRRDSGDLGERTVEAFPPLGTAALDTEPADGVVEGTLGGKLGCAWLDVVVDAHGVEAARPRIVADLIARRADADATVEVVDEPGPREAKVRVEAESSGAPEL